MGTTGSGFQLLTHIFQQERQRISPVMASARGDELTGYTRGVNCCFIADDLHASVAVGRKGLID